MGAVEECFFYTLSQALSFSLSFGGVSKSMHASLPVHSEPLHDRDDPRVLAQPLGGKHAPVDVPSGRATEQILLAQEPFDGCELAFSLVVATDQFSNPSGWKPRGGPAGQRSFQ